MISATVIRDSISPTGNRITTFKLRYPKFIHGEFMTHRVISRNASSSRAIPTAKLIAEVRSDDDRAAPIWWGKNQPGMQAAEELDNTKSIGSERARIINPTMPPPPGISNLTEQQLAKELWAFAAHAAASGAEAMLTLGVHKQIVNRMLEPFSHINVIATATEWDNFFGLRLHKDAQPEMRELANQMWRAREASNPEELFPGEWHLPFIEREDVQACKKMVKLVAMTNDDALSEDEILQATIELAIKVSVARCARVSYESFETGKRSTVDEDLVLYEKLVGAQPLHASPAENQATPDELLSLDERKMERGSCYDDVPWANWRQHGNFVGWRQYRKMIPGESCAPLPEGF